MFWIPIELEIKRDKFVKKFNTDFKSNQNFWGESTSTRVQKRARFVRIFNKWLNQRGAAPNDFWYQTSNFSLDEARYAFKMFCYLDLNVIK